MPGASRCRRRALGFALLLLAAGIVPLHAECPDHPPCRGCGCKGGPGYRGPDGQCVGFRHLYRVCGNPPDSRCTFENAPGTGANRECVLSPRPKRREVPAVEMPPASGPVE